MILFINLALIANYSVEKMWGSKARSPIRNNHSSATQQLNYSALTSGTAWKLGVLTMQLKFQFYQMQYTVAVDFNKVPEEMGESTLCLWPPVAYLKHRILGKKNL